MWNKSTPEDVKKMVGEVSAILGKRPRYSEKSMEGRSYKWWFVDTTKIGEVKVILDEYTDMYAKVTYSVLYRYSEGRGCGIRILCKGIQ